MGITSSALDEGLRPALVAFWRAAGMSDPLSAQGTRRHHRIRSRGDGDARSRAVIVFLSKAWKTAVSQLPKYLRRPEAGDYIHKKYGFCSGRSLASLASRGFGPRYRVVGKGGPVVYEIPELDRWAEEQLSAPIQSPRDLLKVTEAAEAAA